MATALSPRFQQALDRARLDLAGSSVSAEPFSHSKTSNWVAKSGGLPHFIQHMAHDIMESDPGKSESSAIAIAISQCKKLAAKGNAKAAKAIAEWEALKAKNKAKKAVNASAGTDEEAIVLWLSGAWDEPEPVGALPGETPLRLADYTLALSQARLDLGVTTFDPQAHPRDFKGRFKAAVAGLAEGQKLRLPDGLTVRKQGGALLAEKGKLRFSESDPNAKSDIGRAIHENGIDVGGGKRVSGGVAAARTSKDVNTFVDQVLRHSTSAGKSGELPDALGNHVASADDVAKGDVLYDTQNPMHTAGFKVTGFEEFQGKRGIQVKHLLDNKTSILWPEALKGGRYNKKGGEGGPQATDLTDAEKQTQMSRVIGSMRSVARDKGSAKISMAGGVKVSLQNSVSTAGLTWKVEKGGKTQYARSPLEAAKIAHGLGAKHFTVPMPGNGPRPAHHVAAEKANEKLKA